MPEGGKLRIGCDRLTLTERAFWYLGWHPRIGLIAMAALAGLGWWIVQKPVGALLALLGIWLQFKAVRLINSQWKQLLEEAKSKAVAEEAQRLGITLDDAQYYVLTSPRGSPPVGISPPPELCVTTVFLCETFLAASPEVSYSLAHLSMHIPAGGQEIYYRYISAVDYRPPVLQVHLSTGQTREFIVTPDESNALLSALRSKLRGVSLPASASVQNSTTRTGSDEMATNRDNPETESSSAPEEAATSAGSGEWRDESNEVRYCYLRSTKLQELYADAEVLDALLAQLDVPGKSAVLQRLTEQEKKEAIEAQIDHFRRSPTSIWFGVPRLEVLAASIWRSSELTEKLVRYIFCDVGREEDLLRPVARWLRSQGYEPYMEIPLGRRRVDALGYKKAGVFGSDKLVAIELKNDDLQFRRAADQMATFAEYTNAAYVACTPAFAADYLERNAESRGATVKHWDPDLLARRLREGGVGLLIVEREDVCEVLKPTQRTPSKERIASVVSSLSSVRRIEC